MPLPTGSKVDLAFQCLGSVVQPIINTESGPDAELGRALHAFFEHLPKGRDFALSQVPEQFREACESFDTAPFEALKNCATEIALAYDVATGKARRLTPKFHRDYGALADSEIAMTLDVVGVTADSVVVIDYKTGWARVPPAPINWQLKVGALAMSRLYERPTARVAILHAPVGQEPRWDPAFYSADELALAETELLVLMARIEEAARAPYKVELRMGEHCRYCPARLNCRAHGAMLSTLMGANIEDLQHGTKLEPAGAWNAVLAVTKTLEDMRASLEMIAMESPFQLEDGRTVGPVTIAKESLDSEKTNWALSEFYGPAFAAAAGDFRATKASLKRACKAEGLNFDEVLDKLHKANAVKVTTHVEVKAR